MRKLSTFQLTLLVTFSALAVAGILIFALAVGGGNTNTIGPVHIWGTLDQTAFSAVIRQAAEGDGQLSQVTYQQKDPTTYETDLANAIASGTGPDLFLLRQDYAYKDMAKVAVIPFSSLSQSQFENTFVDSASPFIVQTGTLAVPVLADPLVLYWNKDLLASGGFSQPPQYWDQLFSMAKALSKKNDAGSIIKSGVAFGEYSNIGNAKDIVAMLMLQAGSPLTQYDSTGHLTAAIVPRTGGVSSQAAESAVRFYTEFADPSKDHYSWNRSFVSAQQAFASGDVALYVGYATEKPLIAKMNPNLNFAAAAIPQIRNGTRSLDVARIYGFAAPKAGKNPSAAITVAYLLASQSNAGALSSATGLSPARRDLLSQRASGDADLFNKMVIISHAWVDPDPEATADIFRGMIEETTSGAQLVSAVVSRAEQQLGHLLGQ